jgi:hypothetical protein
MKHNKLRFLSLLTSLLVLFAFSFGSAANTVTFGDDTTCPQPVGSKLYIPIVVENDADLGALDIVGKTVTISGGVQIKVTDVSFDTRMSDPSVLSGRYVDAGVYVDPDQFRAGAAKVSGGDADLPSGSGQIATMEVEFQSDCVLGEAGIEGDVASPFGFPVETAFAPAAGGIVYPTVNSGTVTVANTAPSIDNCPANPVVTYWGNPVQINFDATDPDLACGCDELQWSVTDGPGGINASTGLYSYAAPGTDVGCQNIEITVEDNYGGVATCSFQIQVLNKPPVITCPDEVINIIWGNTAEATITAVDPDGGPGSLTYSMVSFNGPGTASIDPTTGDFSWPTLEDPSYMGTFEACVMVDDNANLDACNTENADTCCFQIHVIPTFRVTIEKLHDVLQGHYYDISIDLDNTYINNEMGGYDFLITYDNSALTFVSADPGQLLDDCGWEFFTYRFGAFGNCDGGCPSGLLRLTALAETNNGDNHPDCFTNDGVLTTSGQLATLRFLVSNDRTLECQYAAVEFFWIDCTDNAISSKGGDTLFVERKIYNFEGDEIQDHTYGFPGKYGILDECLLGDYFGKNFPLRDIDFKNGGFDIVCGDSIDATGDINVNGLAYEIGDGVMYTAYFIEGLSAFGDHIEASIAASDANNDGIVLSVSDLVYLIRVIQGDANPYPKPVTGADNFVISTQRNGDGLIVSSEATAEAGAALLHFTVSGTVQSVTPVGSASEMDVKYGVEGNELTVLVYNIGDNAISSGADDMLIVRTDGEIKLAESDVVDFFGNPMNVETRVVPSSYAMKNFPNPFNPTTTIQLSLPQAGDYRIAIYNITGQLIRTFEGHSDAGTVSVVWDGKDSYGHQVATGMYLYQGKSGSYSETRKMMLLK